MYGQKLMEVDLHLTRLFKEALAAGYNILRVGFTRLNFNYFITDEEIEYVLDAVEFVAQYGWMFLPMYDISKSGNWKHKKQLADKPMIGTIDYSSGEMKFPSSKDETLFGTGVLPFQLDKGVIQSFNFYHEAAKTNLVETLEEYKTMYTEPLECQTNTLP